MKRIISVVFIFAAGLTVAAQENRTDIAAPDTSRVVTTPINQTIIGKADAPTNIFVHDDFNKSGIDAADSLHLPALNRFGASYINMYPYDWFGLYNWNLHKGLNINLGASVFATFGDSPWSGAGFAQSISAMYATALTDKLSIAVGGYLDNLYWAHNAYYDAGLNAVIGYKFDEHWEGYLFGQKSLTDKRLPLPLYDMGRIGDRIGAAVKYNFNPNFSVQVTVSAEKYR